MEKGDEGLLVKILITLEPHGIFFYQILHTNYTFNICKTVTRLRQVVVVVRRIQPD